MRNMMLIAALALAACARSEPVDENYGDDVDLGRNLVAESLSDSEESARAGSWLPGADGAAQSIAFQAPNGEILFSIRCDLRGGLVLQRPGLITRGNLALMQLRTGDVVRRLAVTTAGGPSPQVHASVPYNDQLIAALMTFDQPLEVRVDGLETLVLPPTPAVGALVRTCQSSAGVAAPPAELGEPAPAEAQAAPDATTNAAEQTGP
jgi:hypothetical protein